MNIKNSKENIMNNIVKSGFIAVIGRPNSGKSTLLNYLIGSKITMTSHKAQATRKRMNIIVMYENNQLIFIDTPGIHKREKLLNKFMLDEVMRAMGDSDLILFLAPLVDDLKEYENFLNSKYSKKIKHILLLTKIDETSQDNLLKKLSLYQKYQDRSEAIIPFSVKKRIKKDILLKELTKYLPEHPYFFDPEIMTNNHIKDIYKELIMESIFQNLSDEIPYESDVTINKIEESEKIDKIDAVIVVEKSSQKSMIIGKDGATIKRVGQTARKLLEIFSQKKIYLKLIISVKKGWSKNKTLLEKQGYNITL